VVPVATVEARAPEPLVGQALLVVQARYAAAEAAEQNALVPCAAAGCAGVAAGALDAQADLAAVA
jgi:hypothetical protein